ncbi:polysaccharide deacetylase family sporulation protein PdaB [Bacillus testis]|uniref:polysaccharide deacetylase family sporulation protein PdaB n=1 Tax=Bacillus testis TaxID=1622072 RepID=UPI00067F64B6|nr:polysaccharide deacetylase family sporulation protein PdaB [Bacillus testis]
MNFFITLQAKKVKKYVFILTLAFVTAWFLFVQYGPGNPVFSTSNGPKAVYKGEKNVALTFNIGWGDEKAPLILDELENSHVKNATFFLSGSWAERHPHIVKRIQDQGYEIGMLGYNYLDYSQAEDQEVTKDMLKGKESFRKLGIVDIEYVRAPTGHFDKRFLSIAEKFGYTVVHWSVDSKDWTNPGVTRILKNINDTKQGDILLFHASDSAKQTAKALPAVLSVIQEKGLKMVTVSEMISNSSVKTKEIK